MTGPWLAAALLSLGAAPPAPTAPRQSPLVVQVRSPRTGLPPLRAFLAEAGAYSPALRPAELGRGLGAALGVDLLDATALADAGLDADAPLTVSLQHAQLLTCFTAKGKGVTARLEATLAGIGPKITHAYKGATLTGAAIGKSWRAGFMRRGATMCTVSPGPDTLAVLKAATDGLGPAGVGGAKTYRAATAGLSGNAIVYAQAGELGTAFELLPAGKRLTVRGRMVGGPALLDKPRENDPLGAFAAEAPLVARATLAGKSLADPSGPLGAALSFLLHQACPACEPSVARTLLDALKTRATGQVAFVVNGLDRSAAGQPLSSYYLFPHTYLLPLKEPAPVRAALGAALERIKAAGGKVASKGEGHAVSVGPREVLVGVLRDMLVLSSDALARDAAMAALSKCEKQTPAHALSAVFDGKLAAAALAQVSLLDVIKGPELAALFGVSIEAGGLLKALGPVTLVADPVTGGVHLELVLTLAP